MSQEERALAFGALHRKGDPVVLYNIWDAGSARCVAEAGAKALATGSWSVAAAHGYGDGQKLPLPLLLETVREIVAATDLPLSVDFEGAYSEDPAQAAANVAQVIDAGGIGINFEDQMVGRGGVHPIDKQAARIRAIREMAERQGVALFVNARTDLYLKTQEHDAALVDAVIERGKAFADAGASGLFVPRMADARQIEKVVKEVPLPLNLIAFPGAPSKREWANAGVARISQGPFPHRELMAKLEEMASAALA